MWAAFILFYLYKKCSKHSTQKRDWALKIEKYILACLKINKKDVNALFIYLNLALDLSKITTAVKISLKYNIEEIASWIKDIDNYRGYLAWVEIYLHRGDTKQQLFPLLTDLIKEYHIYPEAYFKLWSLNNHDDSIQAMNIIEEMIFYTFETR